MLRPDDLHTWNDLLPEDVRETMRTRSRERMTDTVQLIGKPIEGNPGRDAIHVAVLPMLAVVEMQPGQHTSHGVVDPFLTEPVKAGQRYWLFLQPGTITSLRHVWTHSAFGDEK